MQRTQKNMLILCILNTLAGVLFAALVQVPSQNELPLLAMGASLCLSIVLWTAMALAVSKKYTTWAQFFRTCIKACCFYLIAVFLIAAVLEQPDMGMTGWGENLMTSIFARLLGILLGLILTALGNRLWTAITVHKYHRNNKTT